MTMFGSAVAAAATTLAVFALLNQQTIAWMGSTDDDIRAARDAIVDSVEQQNQFMLSVTEKLNDLETHSSYIASSFELTNSQIAELDDNLIRIESTIQTNEANRLYDDRIIVSNVKAISSILVDEKTSEYLDTAMPLNAVAAELRPMGGRSDRAIDPNFGFRLTRGIPKDISRAELQAIEDAIRTNYVRNLIDKNVSGFVPEIHEVIVVPIDTSTFEDSEPQSISLVAAVVRTEK